MHKIFGETEARKEGYMKQSTLKFNLVSQIQKINFVICFFSFLVTLLSFHGRGKVNIAMSLSAFPSAHNVLIVL